MTYVSILKSIACMYIIYPTVICVIDDGENDSVR